jgi:HEAT repeat protein
MRTDTLVFLKQLLDNSEYANETGVLRVVALFKDPDTDVTEGTSFALGAFDTLIRLAELRPELLTPTVVGELETLAEDADPRVRSAAKAVLETGETETKTV